MAKTLTLFLTAILLSIPPAIAHESDSHNAGLEAAEGLTTYPKDIRQDILEIVQRPKLLQGVIQIQKNASEAFRKLLSSYPKNYQFQIYELARFPKLINELTAGGAKSQKQYKALIKPYPSEIHKIALQAATDHFSLLQKTQALSDQAGREFRELLKGEPQKVEMAFKKILQHPEILFVMAKYPKMVGQTMAAYQKDPQAGLKQADQIIQKVQAGNAKALRNLPDKNPQHQRALAALDKADAQFTTERNKAFDQSLDPSKAVQVNVNFNPYFYGYLGGYGIGLYDYPYWFGFPGWGFDGYDWDDWY